MKKDRNHYIYSPTDLTRFLDSEFVTWMDRFYLDFPGQIKPDPDTEDQKMYAKKGIEHETAYLKALYDKGWDVCEINLQGDENRILTTLKALEAGHHVIYQANLAKPPFEGFADFVLRVDGSSKLGDFHYEVGDTKLARHAKPSHIIQLCCYAEILEAIQGVRPANIQVMLGNGELKSFRTNDYYYCYLQIKEAFLKQQSSFTPETMPIPQHGENFGRWSTEAQRLMDECDHLSRVADIKKGQIKKLEAAGINTLTSLATTDITHIPKMALTTFEKLKHQARLQFESRNLPKPKYELLFLPQEQYQGRFGLELLPPASALDIYFDMEGHPLLEGGLEYLFGVTYLEDSRPKFIDWWAHDNVQEKKAFEDFIDWVYARWRKDPNMHIYHYANYEVRAMRHLMGKYGTREVQVDELLRNEVFVDLYKIVRQGLRVGENSYSIKKIEHLYMDARLTDVKSGGQSIVFYEDWRENPDGEDWRTSAILNDIRNHNKDDCDSTWLLVEWMRRVQQENGLQWIAKPSKVTEETEKMPESSQTEQTSESLAQEILSAIPGDRSTNPEGYRIQELLAWLLEFHRREKKSFWWAHYDRLEKSPEELLDDAECLAMLERTTTPVEPIKQSLAFEYAFHPSQETKLKTGSQCCFYLNGQQYGTRITELNAKAGRVKIQFSKATLSKLGLDDDLLCQMIHLLPVPAASDEVLMKAVRRVVENWWSTKTLPKALEDFLFRHPPTLSRPIRNNKLIPDGEDRLTEIIRVTLDMANTTLCIQGPPGAGKTYTGANIILSLLKQSKKVGISSNSHKAINNLLLKVTEFAEKEGYPLKAAKVKNDVEPEITENSLIDTYKTIKEVPLSSYSMLGGTAWAFCSEVMAEQLDYLFIDEAGQVSLANLVGMSGSTKNIILLGDQMQLGQPIQGAHPGESGQSVLEYYLQGLSTIPEDRGIFLGETYRLHPDICEFISETVYDGRLKSVESETRQQKIVAPAISEWLTKDAGILFLPVEHEGNSQASEEEVTVIQALVQELLQSQFVDKKGNTQQMTWDDILLVAPYNRQVRLLQETLGDQARVGSVDKFQGQEAPVVIVSMCASSTEDIPRGFEFLLSRNRMNVAISRAKSLAIIVGNPEIARTRCTSIEQMGLLNMFCRLTQDYSLTNLKPSVLT